LEIEMMLMELLMLHLFSTQVLLSNLEEKILMVMEYMIKMMRVQKCWFKNSTVVLILMETESKIVLMLVPFGLATLNGCPDTDGDGLLM
jgi:hypothetical protein